MGLTGSLLIGQSALAASQLALQVTGNNIANVGTEGYHRQRVSLVPAPGQQIGPRATVGGGVSVSEVRRALDPALQSRLRNSISDERGASIDHDVLSRIESILDDLSDTGLSNRLAAFFNAFSELANSPAVASGRAAVVEQGAALASQIRDMRSQLLAARTEIDDRLGTEVGRADVLLQQIADLNKAVSASELGGAEDSSLRDQRDKLVSELAGLMDITVIEHDNGSIDVLAGSTPMVLGGRSRGLGFEIISTADGPAARVFLKDKHEVIAIDSGSIGGLMRQREAAITQTLSDLDSLASSIIYEVNRLHVVGRPSSRITDISSTLALSTPDRTLALNDPTNTTFAELPFRPKSGTIEIVLTDTSGQKSTFTVNVDLDGIDAGGVPGFADDTTITTLAADFDAIAGLNAQVTPDGRLRLFTDAGLDLSIKSDSSGALAALGVNSYFQGTDSGDMQIRADLRSDPSRLSVGLGDGTNETALAIAGLRDAAIADLGGDTIAQRWGKTVERTGVQTAAARTTAQAQATVRQSLESQEAAVSGVSLDEEALNMILFQQQYVGAARFIGVVNELTAVLLGLVE